jgi:hypothetical protein
MEFEPTKPEIEPASFETCVSFLESVTSRAFKDGYTTEDAPYIKTFEDISHDDIGKVTVGFMPNTNTQDGSIEYFVIKNECVENKDYGTFSIDTEYCVNAFQIDESFIIQSALLDITNQRIDVPPIEKFPNSTELLETFDRIYSLSSNEQQKEIIDELQSLSYNKKIELRDFLNAVFPPFDGIQLTESDLHEAIALIDAIQD